MRKKQNYLFRIAVIAVLLITTSVGCKKDVEVKPGLQTEMSDNSNLIKFLSISLNVPIDQVVFLKDEKEFVIYGKNRLSLDLIKKTYENANEYKAKYEN